MLISECALPSGKEDPTWPHMNPEKAASLAKEMGAKKLMLTHFDAGKYRTLEEKMEAERVAKKIFPNTAAATDGLRIGV